MEGNVNQSTLISIMEGNEKYPRVWLLSDQTTVRTMMDSGYTMLLSNIAQPEKIDFYLLGRR